MMPFTFTNVERLDAAAGELDVPFEMDEDAFRAFYDRTAPVYLGDYVTQEQGTGIVHSGGAAGFPLPPLRYYVGSEGRQIALTASREKLDLFLPKISSGARPVHLFVHGGVVPHLPLVAELEPA